MTIYADTTRAPRTMTRHEQLLLLRTTGQRFDGYRDHVLLSLALATGMREHELVALNLGDVLADDGKVRGRVQLRVFKRSREDARGQEVVLSSGVQAKLEKFLRWKRQQSEAMATDAPLFVSRKGNRLSTRQVRHAFQLWQRRAGFERRYSFHSVRHSAITNLYEATRDIRLAQRFARHRSITSTQIYTHPTDEALFRAVQELPC
ncbi:MAG: tyrosine-type recombinase/integrase [Deltaproteobacteria bacterium]|nr:tyrosine-type recombinase/integrase [Deltaproteobacteria bacterium]